VKECKIEFFVLLADDDESVKHCDKEGLGCTGKSVRNGRPDHREENVRILYEDENGQRGLLEFYNDPGPNSQRWRSRSSGTLPPTAEDVCFSTKLYSYFMKLSLSVFFYFFFIFSFFCGLKVRRSTPPPDKNKQLKTGKKGETGGSDERGGKDLVTYLLASYLGEGRH
jgi:hypothetical protein